MTQRELAEKADVRLPTISAMANGKIGRVPVDVLDRICAVLECQPGDLMEYIPEQNPTYFDMGDVV